MVALWSLQLQTEKCETYGTFLATELHHNHYGSLLPFALWVQSRVTFHHAPFILVALLYKQQPQQQQLTWSLTSCSSCTLYRRLYCWNMEPGGICVCMCLSTSVYMYVYKRGLHAFISVEWHCCTRHISVLFKPLMH